MTREDYNKSLDMVSAGLVYINGEYVKPAEEMIEDYLSSIDIPINTGISNEYMVVCMFAGLSETIPHWDDDDEPLGILHNLAWLNAVLLNLNVDEPITFPTYEDVVDEDPIDIMLISAMPATYHVYANATKKTLASIIEYIVTKVYVRLEDTTLIGPDGSYIDIYDTNVRYGKNPTAVSDHPKRVFNFKDWRKEIGITPTNRDNIALVYMLTDFVHMVKHNADVRGVTLINYHGLIPMDKLLEPNEYSEIDLDKAEEYLTKLGDSMINAASHCLENYQFVPAPLLRINMDGYSLNNLTPVDICDIDPKGGLSVIVKDKTLDVSITNKDGEQLTLFTAIVYTNTDISTMSHKFMNLYVGTYTPIGVMLTTVLDSMGMLDLFLQAPKLIDSSLKSYLKGGEKGVFSNEIVYLDKSVVPKEYSYILTEHGMMIGVPIEGVFVAAVIIIRDNGHTYLPMTVRFRRHPIVRKFTKTVLTQLEFILSEDNFDKLEEAIAK